MNRSANDGMNNLIEVENLRVSFRTRLGEESEVLHGISFNVGHEKLGIVGESGSGKSITARSILRIMPPGSSTTADSISFKGRELTTLSEKEMCKFRGKHISMIMQDPKYSLNPTMRIGDQIAEMLRLHTKIGKKEALDRSLAALESVHMRDPERVMRAYPLELSGGMGQRVMIAMMLITAPGLLIADEPTSALDVSVQLQILSLLDELVTKSNMGLMFISHALHMVSSFCDRVIVMYKGNIVETCAASELANATHPYTRRLLDATETI